MSTSPSPRRVSGSAGNQERKQEYHTHNQVGTDAMAKNRDKRCWNNVNARRGGAAGRRNAVDAPGKEVEGCITIKQGVTSSESS